MKDKKRSLLGMDPGTASYRLLKDVLFQFVKEAGHKCHRCGQEMTRETFSIEHKEAWMAAADPAKAFFDLGNIAFSHKSCNYGTASKPHKKYQSEAERKREGFRRHYSRNSTAVLARRKARRAAA